MSEPRPPEDPLSASPTVPPRSGWSGRFASALDFLLRCDAKDPDRLRAGRMMGGVLLTLTLTSAISFVVFAIINPIIEQSLPALVDAVVLFAIYLYNRRGRVERTAIITLVTLFLLLNLIAVSSRGAKYPIAFVHFLWAIPIALSGALLPWRAVIITWLLASANIVILHVAFLAAQSGYDRQGNLTWLSGALSILSVLAFSTAFVRHQSDQHLRRVHERNAQLREKQEELSAQRQQLVRLNDSLESEVRVRTAELAAARDEAVRANRVKSDFMANMSHEMRTPMNAVLGITSMLLDTPLNEDQRSLAAGVRTAGTHLLGVIDDILDLSQVESGEMVFRSAPFDAHRCVTDAVAIVALAAKEKGLALRTEIHPEVPKLVISDEGRVRQVLVHLLVNAIKFTPAGSVMVKVTVDAGAPEREGRAALRFAVKDTGIGIPLERKDSLFVPFAQIDTSATRKYGGTGVGLVLCKHVVERLGGALSVESKINKGSTFSFTLPASLPVAEAKPAQLAPRIEAAPAPPEPKAPTNQEVSPPESSERPVKARGGDSVPPLAQTASKRPLKILSVEDNPLNQKVILFQLGKLGYKADTAINGVDAVRAVEQSAYDVVLMDIQMPEMDGMEATRTIRSKVRTERRPWIIAVTAHAMSGYREQCLAAGMDDYLAKPTTFEMLQSALLRALQPGESQPAANDT